MDQRFHFSVKGAKAQMVGAATCELRAFARGLRFDMSRATLMVALLACGASTTTTTEPDETASDQPTPARRLAPEPQSPCARDRVAVHEAEPVEAPALDCDPSQRTDGPFIACRDANGAMTGTTYRTTLGWLDAIGEMQAGERSGEWTFRGRNGRELIRATYQNGRPQRAQWTWRGETLECLPPRTPVLNVSPNANISADCCDRVLYLGRAIEPEGCSPALYEWHDTGVEKCETGWENDVPEGLMLCWWPNGRVKVRGTWADGIRTGEWVHCNEDGTERLVQQYTEGEPDVRDPTGF